MGLIPIFEKRFSMQHEIADLRKEYTKLNLDKGKLVDDPFMQFLVWFEEAQKAGTTEPNAMVLSTVSRDGRPSSRIVLLKGIENHTFQFFTNYNSRKGREMEETSYVALNFFWEKLERQVRIEGRVEKASTAVSDEYFHSRPIGSQIGAWASPQSEPVENRQVIEERQKLFEEKFKNGVIPRPPHWGGYNVVPDRFEFWQGRQNRLHDRFIYTKSKDIWGLSRLAP